MYKKYDTWMAVSHGYEKTMQEGIALLNGLNKFFSDKFLLEGFERIGCAYRIQISCEEETAEKMSKFFNRKFEETRGFVRENCG